MFIIHNKAVYNESSTTTTFLTTLHIFCYCTITYTRADSYLRAH